MKRKNKSAFIRVLSSVILIAMITPLFAMLFSITASAIDSLEGETDTVSPAVSLAWDTSTVIVTDGVAAPYKNASSTASSYTMKYIVTASGTVTNPITVRVQSFELSAKAGTEYATVDNTVTLTAEKSSATGTVTVYTHTGYATKVIDTGNIYTNEFGLRITEVKNAKKESGADTIRSQVLVANGYTLDVVKNKDGVNYGGGTGTFPNGYFYDGMQNDYEYNIGNINQALSFLETWFILPMLYS